MFIVVNLACRPNDREAVKLAAADNLWGAIVPTMLGLHFLLLVLEILLPSGTTRSSPPRRLRARIQMM